MYTFHPLGTKKKKVRLHGSTISATMQPQERKLYKLYACAPSHRGNACSLPAFVNVHSQWTHTIWKGLLMLLLSSSSTFLFANIPVFIKNWHGNNLLRNDSKPDARMFEWTLKLQNWSHLLLSASSLFNSSRLCNWFQIFIAKNLLFWCWQ